MPWFRDKTNAIWVWVKGKWVILATAIAILGAVEVGVILNESPMLPDHALKAPTDKVLWSGEIDWIDRETGQNKGRIIKYDYVSDVEIEQEIYKGLTEDLSRRTANAKVFVKKKTEKEEILIAKIYGGSPFWKDIDGKWYQVETATTTIDAFKKQIGKRIFADIAYAGITYASSGDGFVTNTQAAGWATAHDGATGGSAAANLGTLDAYSLLDGTTGDIRRVSTPFNTGDVIPAGASITAATYNLKAETIRNDDPDGNDYIGVVETFIANETTLGTADYNDIGYDAGNEVAGRAAFEPTVVGAPNIDLDSLVDETYNIWTLDATGRGWIKKAGDTSKCGTNTGWTCLGYREGHDIVDSSIGTNLFNRFTVYASETAGFGSDPYLEVTLAVAAVEVYHQPVFFYEE